MTISEWWREAANEIYWLEITDRPDIGTDLKAPQRRDNGSEFWSYSLVTHTRHGDIVFHYQRQRHAIVAWSRIAGGWWEDDVVWAAHGTSARGMSVAPYKRPGWKAGLTDHEVLEYPLTLDEVRKHRADVLAIEKDLERHYGNTLYLAFSRYADSLRPQQGYLTKLPSAVVQLFPALDQAARRAVSVASDVGLMNQSWSPTYRTSTEVEVAPTVSDSLTPRLRQSQDFGAPYRRVDESASVSTRDPMFPDPALIERGNRGHAIAQNALARSLVELELQPLSPRPGEPNYDIAWMVGGVLWLGEVKSLTRANEERQLRLALGQVLRYSDLLTRRRQVVRPVVMAERMPADQTWLHLCEQLGVLLLWPDRLVDLRTLLGMAPQLDQANRAIQR